MIKEVYSIPNLSNDEEVDAWSTALLARIRARQNRYDELKSRLAEIQSMEPTPELLLEKAAISAEMREMEGNRTM